MVSRILAFLVGAYYFFIGWMLPYIYDYDVVKNVRYAEATNAVMDVYIPADASSRAENGCVIMIHGGSYTGGDKKEERSRCHKLARNGYVVATINYSLYTEGGDFSVDVVMDEITAAIEKLCDFAAERGVNLTAAATAGYSAGGHLAMLYAYTRADESPLPIRFTATMSGPAKISRDIWGDTAYRLTERLTGKTVTPAMVADGRADTLAASVSPTTYVNENSVPTLMAYGKKDTTVAIGNADALAAALKGAGVSYTDIRFSRSEHDMMSNPLKRVKYNRTLVRYCSEYFGY